MERAKRLELSTPYLRLTSGGVPDVLEAMAVPESSDSRLPVFDAYPCATVVCELGEGPFVHDGRLYWVDILQRHLHSCVGGGGDHRILAVPTHLGAAAPWPGGFVTATQGGIGTLSREGEFALLPNSPRLPPELRFNDGKRDPVGRFWCGTMAYQLTPAAGALYCVEPDGAVRRVVEDVTISNGLDWDAKRGLFFYIDTPTRRVDVWDYAAVSGEISNRRLFLQLPPEYGLPDGMSLDDRGRMWIAFWGGGQVIGFDLERRVAVARVLVPASLSSSCWFDRSDRALYITSARTGLTPEQLAREPEAGKIFRADIPSDL
jgi:sugar lactone lactonase YvrE